MKLIKKVKPEIWGILFLCLAFLLISKNVYYITLFVFCGIYIIAVSGLDILFGYSGQISLGHAMFYAAGAYTSSLLALQGVSVWLGILAGIVVSTLLAAVVAIPASKLVHQFLALLTIAVGNMVYVFLSKAKLTGAMTGVKNIPDLSIFGYALDTKLKFGIFMLVMIVLFLFIKSRIINSSTGRALMAIREDVIAADGIGINVRKYKILAFIISAIFTSFAGSMYAHFVGYISPDGFTGTQSILLLTMLLFGGAGNMIGPICGAVVITIMNETLQGFSTYKTLIYGVVILLAILFMPRGVFGLVQDIIRKIKSLFGKPVKNDAEN